MFEGIDLKKGGGGGHYIEQHVTRTKIMWWLALSTYRFGIGLTSTANTSASGNLVAASMALEGYESISGPRRSIQTGEDSKCREDSPRPRAAPVMKQKLINVTNRTKTKEYHEYVPYV